MGFAAFNEMRHVKINIYKNQSDPLYIAFTIYYLMDFSIIITKNSTTILTDINNIFIRQLGGFK